jgi:hypothetical protein
MATATTEKQPQKRNATSFKKGDPKINRKGQPKKVKGPGSTTLIDAMRWVLNHDEVDDRSTLEKQIRLMWKQNPKAFLDQYRAMEAEEKGADKPDAPAVQDVGWEKAEELMRGLLNEWRGREGEPGPPRP